MGGDARHALRQMAGEHADEPVALRPVGEEADGRADEPFAVGGHRGRGAGLYDVVGEIVVERVVRRIVGVSRRERGASARQVRVPDDALDADGGHAVGLDADGVGAVQILVSGDAEEHAALVGRADVEPSGHEQREHVGVGACGHGTQAEHAVAGVAGQVAARQAERRIADGQVGLPRHGAGLGGVERSGALEAALRDAGGGPLVQAAARVVGGEQRARQRVEGEAS